MGGRGGGVRVDEVGIGSVGVRRRNVWRERQQQRRQQRKKERRERIESRRRELQNKAPMVVDSSDSDTSDDEHSRNTVGRIPMEWYNEYNHLGYDRSGNKVRVDTVLPFVLVGFVCVCMYACVCVRACVRVF